MRPRRRAAARSLLRAHRALALCAVFLTTLVPSLTMPAATRADGYDRIASRILAAAQRFKPRRIAVLQFQYIDNRTCDGARTVQQKLTTRLAARAGPRVVEPGLALDVDAVVTGTLIELSNRRIQINARLVRLPDGAVLGGAESVIERTWRDPQALPPRASPAAWLRDALAPPDEDPAGQDEIARYIRERFDALKK